MQNNHSTVNLLHFNKPYHHARHYIGFTTNLDKRITDHLCGMGARLMEVITDAGIEWRVARTWEGDRKLERQEARKMRVRVTNFNGKEIYSSQ